MIKTILFDFSRVILNTRDDSYAGSLNSLHSKLSGSDSYNFFDHYVLNDELLDHARTLRAKYQLVIFTTGAIQDVPEVRGIIDPIFEKIYTVHEIGLPKEGKEAYEFIFNDLNKRPEEVLFIDDQEANVKAAFQAGSQTIRYESNEQLFSALPALLGKG
ncbi:MAG: HAD-IA family hydrolase [bacterium]|nr:HAD-IA family hydrolase [bacterium]